MIYYYHLTLPTLANANTSPPNQALHLQHYLRPQRMTGGGTTFHHRCARPIARNPIWMLSNGKWYTPHMADVLEQVGLQPILTYIQNRRTTSATMQKTSPSTKNA